MDKVDAEFVYAMETGALRCARMAEFPTGVRWSACSCERLSAVSRMASSNRRPSEGWAHVSPIRNAIAYGKDMDASRRWHDGRKSSYCFRFRINPT